MVFIKWLFKVYVYTIRLFQVIFQKLSGHTGKRDWYVIQSFLFVAVPYVKVQYWRVSKLLVVLQVSLNLGIATVREYSPLAHSLRIQLEIPSDLSALVSSNPFSGSFRSFFEWCFRYSVIFVGFHYGVLVQNKHRLDFLVSRWIFFISRISSSLA